MAGMRDAECSIFVANLDSRVSEEILWELFLQAGPVKSVHIPIDKESGKQRNFAFIEFSSSIAAHYAWELLDGIKLYNCPLTVRPQHRENGEITRHQPSNVVSACNFYNDYYHKYAELARRPQSEPRRNQWNEESNHQRNNSFSHPTLNRSFSSPENIPTNLQMRQLLSIASGWSNRPPHMGTPPSWRRDPSLRGSSYGGSPPYGRSPSHAGSPLYPMSPPYSLSSPLNPSYQSSPHGYKSPNQDPYWGK